MTPTSQVVHQYITQNATDVWPLLPYEIKSKLANDIDDIDIDGSYDVGDDIITGSGEEDLNWYVRYTAWYRNHYWDPDMPKDVSDSYAQYYSQGLGYKESSYIKARDYWTKYVIPLYAKGETDEAYYYLGLVAHLLEDAAQPGHVLGDCHADLWNGKTPCFADDSALENFTANTNNYWGDTSGKMNVQHFEGNDYSGQQYNYENLINGFDWSQVDSPDMVSKKNIEFFRLFWYTAQKTQYFASDEEEQNFIYKTISGSTQNWACSGSGSTNLWAGDGYTSCSDFINETQMQIDDPTNSGTYVSAEASGVIPHAMKAVAGLYRLFDDAVRIDWPTENHDYRRTSSTLLKGDMATKEQVEKTAFVLNKNFSKLEQVLKPIVADIDGNGYMETVNFVNNIEDSGKTEIYAVEINGKTTKSKWQKNITGGSTMFPGTLADLDGVSGSRKELITGIRNSSDGTVYAFSISADGKSISQRWVYPLTKKWSPWTESYLTGFCGGTAAVDVNKDGKNEIVFADVATNTDPDWSGAVYVLKDTSGSVSLLANYTFGVGGAYATISAADVDGDGYPEIFVPGMYALERGEL